MNMCGYILLICRSASSVRKCVSSYEQDQNMARVEGILESVLRCASLPKMFRFFLRGGGGSGLLGGSLVTTAWRSLGFGWRRRPPDSEGSCEYIE
jgi:hypothetical protein